MVVALNTFVFCQVIVEVMVAKKFAVIAIHGDVFPLQFVDNIHRMRLLIDTLTYPLLRITYFQPAVVTCNLRSTVRIHHPDERVETMYLRCVHHIIYIDFIIFVH